MRPVGDTSLNNVSLILKESHVVLATVGGIRSVLMGQIPPEGFVQKAKLRPLSRAELLEQRNLYILFDSG